MSELELRRMSTDLHFAGEFTGTTEGLIVMDSNAILTDSCISSTRISIHRTQIPMSASYRPFTHCRL